MEKYTGNSKIQIWTKEHFYAFDADIRQMEDQILWYRKVKLDVLAPSSFSYYLYERKVEEFRKEWENLQEECKTSDWKSLEQHIRKRMMELIKQDDITLEDYPDNEIVLEVRKIHKKQCKKWEECLQMGILK